MRARALGHLPGGVPARVAVSRPQRLYHYTSKLHLPIILESGHLRLTDSNIDFTGAGPGVVWFTDTPSAVGIGTTPGFKDTVEITIDTPADAAWWPEWSRDHGIDEDWYEALAGAAGGSPDRWWVVPHEVPVSAFLSLKVDGKVVKTSGRDESVDLTPDQRARFDGTSVKTAEADTAGVMVCLIPEEEATIALMEAADSTEDFDEQHITLLYLGSTEDAGGDAGRERLHRAVYDFAMHSGHDVLDGKANGWGVFNNDGETALVALWDIPNIAEFRASLKQHLIDHGVPMRDEDHGFTPHQTMRYEDSVVTQMPPPVAPAPESRFTHVVISWGDEWSSVALESALDSQMPTVAAHLSRVARDGRTFDETKHPRGGNTDNRGQFSTAPGAGGTVVPESKRPDLTRRQQQPTPTAMPQQKPVKRPKGYERTPDAVFAKMLKGGDIYGQHIAAGEFPVGDPRNDPEYKARAEKVEALSHKYVDLTREQATKSPVGGQTSALFDQMHNPETGRNDGWDPEREQLHHQILTDYFQRATKGVPKEGKALIMAGPSGSGKSTFLRVHGASLGVQMDARGNPVNYAVVNPDDFKTLIPLDMSRYPGLSENECAGIKHEESSVLATMATQMLMSRGYNVIIDATLNNADKAAAKYVTADWCKKYKDYTVALVDGDMANSRQNAGNRWKQTDKATGRRQFSGRFIPSSLIETQAPTAPGYRSKNAQEFVKFSQLPQIKRAVVYDPYAPQVGLQEAKSAIREAIRRNPALAGMLRATARDEEGEDHQVTQITDKIRAFLGGQITRAALIQYLTHDVRYKPTPKSPYPTGSAQWYRWNEDKPYTPGSFDEVQYAYTSGLLPSEIYLTVSKDLWGDSVPQS